MTESGEPISEHRRSGRVVLRGRGVELVRQHDRGGTADERLLRRPPRPAFLDSDPWRVLRILGEFVDAGLASLERVLARTLDAEA